MAGTTNSTGTTGSGNDEAKARPLTDEADIGSGEKTPAQLETEEQIRQIPPLPAGDREPAGAKDGAPTSSGPNGI